MLSTTSNNPWTRFLQPIIDIIIHVEGKTFPCNKALLTQHSGYFRTVLSPTTTSLILPTVPAEYFTLLLASMSSTLEVNEGNVYQLLLYGQLLQMPAVVLQCKAYLANQALNVSAELMLPSSSRSVSNTVVRPVPNKLQNTTVSSRYFYSLTTNCVNWRYSNNNLNYGNLGFTQQRFIKTGYQDLRWLEALLIKLRAYLRSLGLVITPKPPKKLKIQR